MPPMRLALYDFQYTFDDPTVITKLNIQLMKHQKFKSLSSFTMNLKKTSKIPIYSMTYNFNLSYKSYIMDGMQFVYHLKSNINDACVNLLVLYTQFEDHSIKIDDIIFIKNVYFGEEFNRTFSIIIPFKQKTLSIFPN